MFLLDINVLIALADGDHLKHEAANAFFREATFHGWATCPLIENGFLRILGHPGYEQGPGSPEDARFLLRAFRSAPGHQFWPDALSLCDVLFPSLPASKHLTDFYLLALAIHHGGRLATFDRRINPDLLPGGPAAYHVIGEIESR